MPTLIRNPAPAWKADALVGEEFKTISSADLKGQCEFSISVCRTRGDTCCLPQAQVGRLGLLTSSRNFTAAQYKLPGMLRRCAAVRFVRKVHSPFYRHFHSLLYADYVLVFYPLDFTFVCPTELIAYSERAAEFEAAGAKVLGISVDSKFSHKAWVDMPRE